jgi:hypothetical protein
MGSSETLINIYQTTWCTFQKTETVIFIVTTVSISDLTCEFVPFPQPSRQLLGCYLIILEV